MVLQGVQFTTAYEALERGLMVKHVNPRNTSPICPRCRFVEDRDMVACMNLSTKYARCGGLGVPLRAPPRAMRGNKTSDETDINLYKPTSES